MREFFRGIIWPRTDKTKPNIYRYVVVGMLVSDKPITEFSGSQYILNGNAFGLSDTLAGIKAVKTDVGLGTADNVLTNLEYIGEIANDVTV